VEWRPAKARRQQLSSRRSRVIRAPTGARAFALAGDTATARKASQDFFEVWKYADPDIPILEEAKTEYARLR